MSASMSGEHQSAVVAFVGKFVEGYTAAIDKNFADVRRVFGNAGLADAFFPPYGRTVGIDVAVAAFYTQIDFYAFLVDERGMFVTEFVEKVADSLSGFGREWRDEVPLTHRVRQLKELLGLTDATILPPSPRIEVLNVPTGRFLSSGIPHVETIAYNTGVDFGNQAGERATRALPEVLSDRKIAETKRRFAEEYQRLAKLPPTQFQRRGIEFEKLWRDVLQFHGWNPQKIRIAGEDNDFTAIWQGHHVLGEIRWFTEQMDGGKIREFQAKLGPRPQSIGLFISHSGLNRGGFDAIRRLIGKTTVVVFDRTEIDEVLLKGTDPGDLFAVKLREAYDYLFEQRE